jgi:hypothetical protein
MLKPMSFYEIATLAACMVVGAMKGERAGVSIWAFSIGRVIYTLFGLGYAKALVGLRRWLCRFFRRFI